MSIFWNCWHDRVGPLFPGRFRAIPIEDGAWAFTVSLYVHLNPLRIAGLGLDKQGRFQESRGWRTPSPEQVTVRLRQLRQYIWSSYRAYAGYAAIPPWLETTELLQRVHRDEQRRQAAYRQAARLALSHGVEPERAERLRDAVAIGSARFAQRIRHEGVSVALDGISGKRQLRRRISVNVVRRATEQLMGAPWAVFAQQYGNWGCALFLWGLRQLSGLTLREAGKQAGGMHFSTVSTAIRRLEQRAASDTTVRELQLRLRQLANDEP